MTAFDMQALALETVRRAWRAAGGALFRALLQQPEKVAWEGGTSGVAALAACAYAEALRWRFLRLVCHNQRARLKRQYRTAQTVAIMPSAMM